MSERLFASALYQPFIHTRPPARLAALPEDPWPGDPANADRLFQGRYRFAGEEIISPNAAPWNLPETSPAFRAELHGFTWLRDFHTAGGDAARRVARALVVDWIARYADWDPLAWRGDVLARRLIAWLSHTGYLADGAEPGFATRFLASFAGQVRHLHRVVRLMPRSGERLTALIALAHSELCLGAKPVRWRRLVILLSQAIDDVVLADGGHASRNPARQLDLLRDLIALKSACLLADTELPAALQNAIDRMAPMLRALRHADGGLALFHGSCEMDSAAIDLVLTRSDARGKAPDSAPLSGYERLVARRSLLIVDAGSPPDPVFGPPHASPLAFEFSSGKDRLVVNCGAPRRNDGEWGRALTHSAAHSTAIIAESDAADRQGERFLPLTIGIDRNEQDGAVWVNVEHDGYQRRHGSLHRRRLYLSADGDDLRGQDTLTGSARTRGLGFVIRFHLHPSVHPSLLQNGAAAILKTASGQGWRFRAAGGTLGLEASVYFGQDGEQRRCQQLVISGSMEPGSDTVVKWALSRMLSG